MNQDTLTGWRVRCLSTNTPGQALVQATWHAGGQGQVLEFGPMSDQRALALQDMLTEMPPTGGGFGVELARRAEENAALRAEVARLESREDTIQRLITQLLAELPGPDAVKVDLMALLQEIWAERKARGDTAPGQMERDEVAALRTQVAAYRAALEPLRSLWYPLAAPDEYVLYQQEGPYQPGRITVGHVRAAGAAGEAGRDGAD